jgi:hypothetical protein
MSSHWKMQQREAHQLLARNKEAKWHPLQKQNTQMGSRIAVVKICNRDNEARIHASSPSRSDRHVLTFGFFSSRCTFAHLDSVVRDPHVEEEGRGQSMARW